MRKIIHVDMDCFYAAIEMRNHPELNGKPIAVGGRPDKRGVLCTCSYEARKYGLHSAMPTARALQLCPSLILLPVDMPKYREVSLRIRAIFEKFTDLIEPLSLDEAYLDVTHSTTCQGSATLIAQEIRKCIRQQEQLTASAGVAPNKFLAKVASDWNKPNGQLVITPDNVRAFVNKLSVEKIHGVGKVTADKLHAMGVKTCLDLQQLGQKKLIERFGKFGVQLYELAHGVDNRPVRPERVRKSLSAEETFERDLVNPWECLTVLEASVYPEFIRRFARIHAKEQAAVRAVFVKVKFSDFTQTTVQASFNNLNLEPFVLLCKKGLRRRPLPVRLLGVGVHFNETRGLQLTLKF